MASDPSAPPPRVEVITSVQRRRRWSTAEKVRLVEEAAQPGMSVSYVARRHGLAPSQPFGWKRRMLEGGFHPAGSSTSAGPRRAPSANTSGVSARRP